MGGDADRGQRAPGRLTDAGSRLAIPDSTGQEGQERWRKAA
jgi:hypothetical protein